MWHSHRIPRGNTVNTLVSSLEDGTDQSGAATCRTQIKQCGSKTIQSKGTMWPNHWVPHGTPWMASWAWTGPNIARKIGDQFGYQIGNLEVKLVVDLEASRWL